MVHWNSSHTNSGHTLASNDINITAESGNITISNGAVDKYVNIMRDVSADNQSGDARLSVFRYSLPQLCK